MKKYILLLSCIFLLSGNAYAKDLYFSHLSKGAQAKVLEFWRNETKKEIRELAKQMPVQLDAATFIDSVMYLNNSLVYIASVDDEEMRQAFRDDGFEISAEEFWNDELAKSYMKTYMTTIATNSVCSTPVLNVHLTIGTIRSVKYKYRRDNGFNLFDVDIKDCKGYETEPLVLPNGNRLFP